MRRRSQQSKQDRDPGAKQRVVEGCVHHRRPRRSPSAFERIFCKRGRRSAPGNGHSLRPKRAIHFCVQRRFAESAASYVEVRDRRVERGKYRGRGSKRHSQSRRSGSSERWRGAAWPGRPLSGRSTLNCGSSRSESLDCSMHLNCSSHLWIFSLRRAFVQICPAGIMR